MATSETLRFIIDADGALARKEFAGLSDEASKAFGQIDRKIATFAEGLADIGKGAAVGAALYGLANAAGDFGEAVNAANVVLGDASEGVQEWADTANESAGLGKTAALEVATSFGAIGAQAGLSGEALEQWSVSLSQVSADLASVYNKDTVQVAEALASGLRGEAEAAKALNIDLSDTALKNQLVTLTGERVKGTLSQQEKAFAAYSKIMESTTDIQGDFARTSESLANSQKTAAANLQNTAIAVGESLLPTFESLIGVAGDAAGAVEQIPQPLIELGTAAATAYAGTKLLGGGFKIAGRSALNAGVGFTRVGTGMQQAAVGAGLMNTMIPGTTTNIGSMNAASARAGGAVKGMGKAFGRAASVMGGPWGVALAGSVVGLTLLPGLLDRVSGRSAEAAERLARVGEAALDIDLTGGIEGIDKATDEVLEFTEATRDLFEGSFDSREFRQAQVDMGLLGESFADSGNYIAESGVHIDEFKDKLGDFNLQELRLVDELLEDIFDMPEGSEELAGAQEALSEAIAAGEKELAKQAAAQLVVEEAMQKTIGAAKEQAQLSGQVEVSVKDMSAALVSAASGTDNFVDSLQGASKIGKTFAASLDALSNLDDQIDAAQELGDAWRALGEEDLDLSALGAIEDFANIDYKGLTEETSAAVDAVQDLGTAYSGMLASQIAMGGSLEEVTASSAGYRNELVALLAEAGLGEDQIKSLLTSFGLMPDQIETAFELTGIEAAQLALQVFGSDIDKLPPEVKVELFTAAKAGDEETVQRILSGELDGVTFPLTADPDEALRTIWKTWEVGETEVTFPQVADPDDALRTIWKTWEVASEDQEFPLGADPAEAHFLAGIAQASARRGQSFDIGANIDPAVSAIYALQHIMSRVLSGIQVQMTAVTQMARTAAAQAAAAQRAAAAVPTVPALPPWAGGPAQSSVVVNMPAGSDGADVTRALRRYQARNGTAA